MYNLIDVKKDTSYIHLISEIEKDAIGSSHRNRKNYIDLETVISKFLSYEILLDENDKLIAASGLQVYPGNSGRVASRTYIMSDYRKQAGGRLQLSEDIFVPYEVEVAKEHGLDAVFFTIELLRRRNAVSRFCKNLQRNNLNFTLYPQMINTCRKYISNGIECTNYEQPCWQNAGVLELTGELTLPTMSVAEYNDRYYDDEVNRLK